MSPPAGSRKTGYWGKPPVAPVPTKTSGSVRSLPEKLRERLPGACFNSVAKKRHFDEDKKQQQAAITEASLKIPSRNYTQCLWKGIDLQYGLCCAGFLTIFYSMDLSIYHSEIAA
jgi:hypothetical protein